MSAWLEPRWSEERPSDAATWAAWEETTFSLAPLTDERIDRLLAALGATYGDGVRFGSFSLPANPVLDWYASRNRFDEFGFVDRFVSSDAMHELLPELAVEELPADMRFEWDLENSFALDGQLAAHAAGHGYDPRRLGDEKAKTLGRAFCDAFFGTRYSEVVVFRSYEAWSGWFHDIGWDLTWIVIDKRHRRTSILALTVIEA
jgi:hypothetical protein